MDAPSCKSTRVIGQNVRRLRQARSLSQQRLAAKADLSLRTLTRIEADETQPNLATVYRLATALGVPFTDLLMGGDAA